jgi:tetratricopeptide (TPR) repeat protein
MRDYDLGYFEQALREAEQAYRLYPLPQILFNIGQCHRALEHWERAAFFYRRYLSKFPGAPNRTRVEELLTEAEYKIKAERLAAPQPAALPPAPVAEAPLPPPAPPPAVLPTVLPAAPAPAVTETAETEPAQPHSHALGIGLLVSGIAVLAVAGIGLAEVLSFQSSEAQSHTGQNVPSEVTSANVWANVGIGCAVLGVAGVAGAALTW